VKKEVQIKRRKLAMKTIFIQIWYILPPWMWNEDVQNENGDGKEMENIEEEKKKLCSIQSMALGNRLSCFYLECLKHFLQIDLSFLMVK
jgi:hypothetical protein